MTEPWCWERYDGMLHPELVGDRLRFSTYLCNLGGDNDPREAVERWNEEGEIGISCNFRISQALDSMIDIYERYPSRTTVCIEEKPKFDALRAELQQMIDRIDALKFD